MPSRLEPEALPRRDFLGLAGLCSAGLAILGSLIGMARLPRPAVLPEQASRFRIGRPDDFPVGIEKVIPGRNIRVISTSEGLAAVSLICTHLGCVAAKIDQGYSCPCHGSKFGLEGQVLSGPAPRALRWLELGRAPDGSIVVDMQREVPPMSFLALDRTLA